MQEHEKLERSGNLQKTINDVQRTIDLLVNARNVISSDERIAQKSLEKLQKPIQQSCDKVNNDLKEVYKALNSYSKALDKVLPLLFYRCPRKNTWSLS